LRELGNQGQNLQQQRRAAVKNKSERKDAMPKIIKRKSTQKSMAMAMAATHHVEARLARGRSRVEATFPIAQPKAGLPHDYSNVLVEIKQRIQRVRLRVVLAANSTMVRLYWDIGRVILRRQGDAGWGAKVIDRLSADLREAYPEQQGFSSRNLKYMRAFAAAWPKATIVQTGRCTIALASKHCIAGEISDV